MLSPLGRGQGRTTVNIIDMITCVTIINITISITSTSTITIVVIVIIISSSMISTSIVISISIITREARTGPRTWRRSEDSDVKW